MYVNYFPKNYWKVEVKHDNSGSGTEFRKGQFLTCPCLAPLTAGRIFHPTVSSMVYSTCIICLYQDISKSFKVWCNWNKTYYIIAMSDKFLYFENPNCPFKIFPINNEPPSIQIYMCVIWTLFIKYHKTRLNLIIFYKNNPIHEMFSV